MKQTVPQCVDHVSIEQISFQAVSRRDQYHPNLLVNNTSPQMKLGVNFDVWRTLLQCSGPLALATTSTDVGWRSSTPHGEDNVRMFSSHITELPPMMHHVFLTLLYSESLSKPRKTH